MDTLREEILRVADGITLALRNAGQSFAFLSDGRDLVSIAEAEGGLVGRFSDHSDEGWPAFEFPLPPASRFQQATESVLTRGAVFYVEQGLDALRELGLEGEFDHRAFHAGLPADAEYLAREVRYGKDRNKVMTILTVRQRRDPDAIPSALTSRFTRSSGTS